LNNSLKGPRRWGRAYRQGPREDPLRSSNRDAGCPEKFKILVYFMTNPEPFDPDLLLKRFEEELDAFIFFHLGADARVAVTRGLTGIEIAVEHQRVHDFSVKIDSQQLQRMAEDAGYFETILLDCLSKYRRHV
jgi:hypothetical protein